MTRTSTRLLAALVPALLLAPVAAHAESVTVDDAVGDAKAVNMAVALGGLFGPTAPEGPELIDAPDETSVDVVRTSVDHARKRLTLTVQFRDLVDVTGHQVDFRIITPKTRFALSVAQVNGRTRSELYPLSRTVQATVSEDGTTIVSDTGSAKPCRTVRARYDLAANTLVASAPTACLGSPEWVQVSAAVLRTTVTPQADGSATVAAHVDDAFRGGVSPRSLGRSPRVHRG